MTSMAPCRQHLSEKFSTLSRRLTVDEEDMQIVVENTFINVRCTSCPSVLRQISAPAKLESAKSESAKSETVSVSTASAVDSVQSSPKSSYRSNALDSDDDRSTSRQTSEQARSIAEEINRGLLSAVVMPSAAKDADPSAADDRIPRNPLQDDFSLQTKRVESCASSTAATTLDAATLETDSIISSEAMKEQELTELERQQSLASTTASPSGSPRRGGSGSGVSAVRRGSDQRRPTGGAGATLNPFSVLLGQTSDSSSAEEDITMGSRRRRRRSSEEQLASDAEAEPSASPISTCDGSSSPSKSARRRRRQKAAAAQAAADMAVLDEAAALSREEDVELRAKLAAAEKAAAAQAAPGTAPKKEAAKEASAQKASKGASGSAPSLPARSLQQQSAPIHFSSSLPLPLQARCTSIPIAVVNSSTAASCDATRASQSSAKASSKTPTTASAKAASALGTRTQQAAAGRSTASAAVAAAAAGPATASPAGGKAPAASDSGCSTSASSARAAGMSISKVAASSSSTPSSTIGSSTATSTPVRRTGGPGVPSIQRGFLLGGRNKTRAVVAAPESSGAVASVAPAASSSTAAVSSSPPKEASEKAGKGETALGQSGTSTSSSPSAASSGSSSSSSKMSSSSEVAKSGPSSGNKARLERLVTLTPEAIKHRRHVKDSILGMQLQRQGSCRTAASSCLCTERLEALPVISPGELARYGCTNSKMLVSLYGFVFDVTSAPGKFGAEGKFREYTGKDMTWALITGQAADCDQYYDMFKDAFHHFAFVTCLYTWAVKYEREFEAPVAYLATYLEEEQLPSPPPQDQRPLPDCPVQ
eukprot:TRINITY_DN7811_c0_g3_i1.p1 TRINITY_DN7811_c0_g3~~TRINITY_DN7811_c0_g3_i1.p1  ORF type:complete len:856 (-),score=216.21 TRINITY_DN7811_c0_g3_i1:228-2696(-)